MSLQNVPGSAAIPFIPYFLASSANPSNTTTILMDAAKEAMIMIGNVITSDGGSHTIDTTGSSSLGWRASSVTFANAGTTVKVGLAAVDTSNGPPGRAVNVSDVITLDVAAVFTGGGGGITANAWQASVPTTGTKTIANGDLVAFCVQMTALGGADLVNGTIVNSSAYQRPEVTGFTGGAYASGQSLPNAIITFSDGTLGYFYGSAVFSTIGSSTFNSGSGTKEFGQLYQFPFPLIVDGIGGWINPAASADCDVVLYIDPLGTPVASATASLVAKTLQSTGASRFMVPFASPVTIAANTPFATILKPSTANNVTIYNKVLASAGHRIVDPYGATGYGVSRASGAFANVNSSLTHHFIGPFGSAFADDAPSGFPASRMRLGM